MSKGLEALEDLRFQVGNITYFHKNADGLPIRSTCLVRDSGLFETVEKELKVLEILNKRGIKLIIPEGTYLKEHIDIQLFTNTLSKDELELIKEVLDL